MRELFERDCPYYLSIGMTYDEYWNGDPTMVGAFYRAEQIRQERVDAESWVLGAYFKKAIESSIGNAFLQKGNEPIEYPSEPWATTERKKREPPQKSEEQEERDALFAKIYMREFERMGKDWGKKNTVNEEIQDKGGE